MLCSSPDVHSLEDVSILEDGSPVRNGDEVELFHLGTEKLLNSHDVAAPLSPALQEVAGYINYSAQFVPHLKWKLVMACACAYACTCTCECTCACACECTCAE